MVYLTAKNRHGIYFGRAIKIDSNSGKEPVNSQSNSYGEASRNCYHSSYSPIPQYIALSKTYAALEEMIAINNQMEDFTHER